MPQTEETGLLNVLRWTFENYCRANFLKRVWAKVFLRVLEELKQCSLSEEESARLNGYIDGLRQAAPPLYIASRKALGG